ncbi:unnamed protein product [Cylicostephanus goldi]|uniref:Uncharacterized protein n=1 Tax=Cylicostephanus goldi TaxID=71465 RepID=A0A3P7QKP0_CYLGO|nr:unnamed protein product [Cylicostephanus goldi]
MGDGFRPNSRFSWLRRKNTNFHDDTKSVTQMFVIRRTHAQEHEIAPYTTEENLDSIVDFVIERERLKAAIAEQGLCDAYLYR